MGLEIWQARIVSFNLQNPPVKKRAVGSNRERKTFAERLKAALERGNTPDSAASNNNNNNNNNAVAVSKEINSRDAIVAAARTRRESGGFMLDEEHHVHNCSAGGDGGSSEYSFEWNLMVSSVLFNWNA